MKETYLYNFDLLKPHFYIWGLQGYTLFFLFLLENIDCGYSLEPPRRGGFDEYQQSVEQKYEKISEVFIWKCSVFGGDFFYIFE